MNGIRVYTIGVGTIGKARSPVAKVGNRFQYDWVEVEIDETVLKEIAKIRGDAISALPMQKNLRAFTPKSIRWKKHDSTCCGQSKNRGIPTLWHSRGAGFCRRISSPSIRHSHADMTALHQRKFKVFANGVALALAEIMFWAALLAAYYSIKRIAPNVQLENEAWWGILLALPISLAIFLWAFGKNNAGRKHWPMKSRGPNCYPIGNLNFTGGGFLLAHGTGRHVDRGFGPESRSAIERSQKRRRGFDGGPRCLHKHGS